MLVDVPEPERQAAIDDATDELTGLVVDRLLPVVHRYQTAVAARLGLGLPELLCLDLLRRLGPLSSGTIGERIGMTRSSVSKMVRRLEDGGHVVTEPDPAHRQGLEVRLLPHEERDRVLAAFRRRVRATVESAVLTYGLHRDDRMASTSGLLIQVVHGLGVLVKREAERAWWERAVVRRRRAREAAGLR
jgi:DNA-binding MarR family transcriptional regulator